MNNDSLWKLVFETQTAIVPHYQPVFDRFCAATGLDGPLVGLLLEALTFEPEVTSPARLLVRNPYTAADTFMARLWVVAEKGFLIEGAPGEYRLTSIGRARIEDLIREARIAMAKVDPLPVELGARLAGLLHTLVQSCLDWPPPPEPWSIRHSYNLMPPFQPALPFIEQALSCLHFYRDDAHLAAWQKTGLSATALETLSVLWSGKATSLDTIIQHLARRGHSPQVYGHALEDLRQRGFIEGPDQAPLLTPAGKTFRAEVEQETDDYFFAPWGSLEQAQKDELAVLLERMRDKLNEKKE